MGGMSGGERGGDRVVGTQIPLEWKVDGEVIQQGGTRSGPRIHTEEAITMCMPLIHERAWIGVGKRFSRG